MPNLANIISVIRRKIRLVLKGIKVIRIYMAKLVELAIYLPSSYFFFSSCLFRFTPSPLALFSARDER